METHFDFAQPENGSPRKVIQDVRVLIQDVEGVLKEARQRWGAKSREELDVALEKMHLARRKLEAQARRTAEHTAEVVSKHPYESLGIALIGGLILGLLLSRR
ncbi:MAG TPA: hypothetical protein DCY13_23555 [Verrucomicrobiales bacterium]|nr:hypothetical protein [Verrucomicrobiales bacterium]